MTEFDSPLVVGTLSIRSMTEFVTGARLSLSASWPGALFQSEV